MPCCPGIWEPQFSAGWVHQSVLLIAAAMQLEAAFAGHDLRAQAQAALQLVPCDLEPGLEVRAHNCICS